MVISIPVVKSLRFSVKPNDSSKRSQDDKENNKETKIWTQL